MLLHLVYGISRAAGPATEKRRFRADLPLRGPDEGGIPWEIDR
jgi:hypothetical protein